MENVEIINKNFWKNKKVFLTGHTGFKGSWLSLLLHYLGADITGYALVPPTEPSLFELCDTEQIIVSNIYDIRDLNKLSECMIKAEPEIVIHMAAQPLVRESYKNPLETYQTNVMGTVHLFEAIRKCPSVRSVVNVTTDKCYENIEKDVAYKEDEPLGGYDPYSNSKACSELVTSAYRNSFFNPKEYEKHGVAVATARAGNVIGGGDWAADRLIPDCVRAFLKKENIFIRYPQATRPWQHVLEPLNGYLILAEKLYNEGADYAEAWNFGPDVSDAKPVEWIVKKMCEKFNSAISYSIDKNEHPHEAGFLKLDCSKAINKLGWRPKWNIDTALNKIVEWTLAYRNKQNIRDVCLKQINEYLTA